MVWFIDLVCCLLWLVVFIWLDSCLGSVVGVGWLWTCLRWLVLVEWFWCFNDFKRLCGGWFCDLWVVVIALCCVWLGVALFVVALVLSGFVWLP